MNIKEAAVAWRLSSVGCGWLIGIPVFFIGLGGYLAFEGINHSLNYAEVPATVTAVKPVCAFDIDSPLYTGKMVWGSCGVMSDAPYEQVKAQKMVRNHEVDFTFVSPADGKTHEGTFTVHGSGAAQGIGSLYAGATGMIWVHDDDPARYHYHAWPFAKPRKFE